MLAVDQGCGGFVAVLFRFERLDVSARDDHGKSALDYAKEVDVMGIDGRGFDLISAYEKVARKTSAKSPPKLRSRSPTSPAAVLVRP